jgi:hypothetical protein
MAAFFAYPNQTSIIGDAFIKIDRTSRDDSRVTQAHDSDFRIGDRFSAASLSLDELLLLYGYAPASRGERLALHVDRGRDSRTIVLHARAINWFTYEPPLATALWVVTNVFNAVTMTIAGILALLRPGILTGSLFFALFGILIGVVDPRPLPLPGLLCFSLYTAGFGFKAYCQWASVRCATRFPHGDAGPLAGPLLGAAGILALLIGGISMVRNAAGVLYPIAAAPDTLISDNPGSLNFLAWTVGGTLIALLAVAAMLLRYRASPAEDRLKLRAMLIAIAVFAGYTAAQNASYFFVPFHNGATIFDELLELCGLVVFLVPITIFAAILRHRLLGIRFVIDRALVYSGLALILVAPLRLVNLVLSNRFPHTRVTEMAEVAVALALALSLDRLRAWIERLLRWTLFRKREQSLETLAGLTRAAATAPDQATLSALLQGCVDALELTGARWTGTAANDTPADPALVVGTLSFGGHRSGADIDSEEIRALKTFADAFERAAERLDADRLRSEVALLRARLEDAVLQA